LQAIHTQELLPNEITYGALVNACEKGQQPEQAWEIFQAMQRQDIMPNSIT